MANLLHLDTDAVVTLSLTMEQLTDLRVACLHRMDALKRTIEGESSAYAKSHDLHLAYTRTKAMLDDGGILQLALHRFLRHRRETLNGLQQSSKESKSSST